MCDKCPKEVCDSTHSNQTQPTFIFRGSHVHIHPPCFRPSRDIFEIENNDFSTNYYYTTKTLLEVITHAMELNNTTLEDVLKLTKIRRMLN